MNQEKTEKLLQMQENPSAYSEQEWDQMLTDEEARDTLRTMALLRKAYAREEFSDQDEEQTEREWQRMRSRMRLKQHRKTHRIAASVAGLVLVSGLAIAAFRPGGFLRQEKNFEPQPSEQVSTKRPKPQKTQDSQAEKDEQESIVFDNQTLEEILSQMAHYYRAEVIFQSERIRQLRFHFVWRKGETLQQTVKRLNYFEHVDIKLQDGKLIVEEGQ